MTLAPAAIVNINYSSTPRQNNLRPHRKGSFTSVFSTQYIIFEFQKKIKKNANRQDKQIETKETGIYHNETEIWHTFWTDQAQNLI